MARLDSTELKTLEKREKHLSILAAVFVLGAGQRNGVIDVSDGVLASGRGPTS